jgi:hypothetical protein
MWKQIFLCLCLFLLAACGGAGSDAADPADTVERYLTAKVGGDGDTVRSMLCSDMEAAQDREANAFTSVTGATIKGMECARVGDSDVVTCTGTIKAVYGTEAAEFALSSYKVIQEDGEWKWCGETAAP